jgi:hypothetical protein
MPLPLSLYVAASPSHFACLSPPYTSKTTKNRKNRKKKKRSHAVCGSVYCCEEFYVSSFIGEFLNSCYELGTNKVLYILLLNF